VDPATTLPHQRQRRAVHHRPAIQLLLGHGDHHQQPDHINRPGPVNTANFANFMGGTFSVQSVGGSVFLNFRPAGADESAVLCAAGAGAVTAARRRFRSRPL